MELKEETSLECITLKCLLTSKYIITGLSYEGMTIYVAFVNGNLRDTNLDGTWDIKYIIINIEIISEFVY